MLSFCVCKIEEEKGRFRKFGLLKKRSSFALLISAK